ncbi:hypothetical protein RFI_30868 [Reticulomyxa filosa]|uniref:Uncharacterized protein n=1 Tax=Reticulomyxa filosa TaxID=46433 RepID=X6M0M2_RETFI|nr:hypothetical protein RFI_30868 [Reticulomyxa filosa]|eukprot:ETO06525.1 hypothetical protein RFI_30868 [Reticulomyxa filosa]
MGSIPASFLSSTEMNIFQNPSNVSFPSRSTVPSNGMTINPSLLPLTPSLPIPFVSSKEKTELVPPSKVVDEVLNYGVQQMINGASEMSARTASKISFFSMTEPVKMPSFYCVYVFGLQLKPLSRETCLRLPFVLQSNFSETILQAVNKRNESLQEGQQDHETLIKVPKASPNKPKGKKTKKKKQKFEGKEKSRKKHKLHNEVVEEVQFLIKRERKQTVGFF